MTTTHILFSEAVTSLRLDLCTVLDRDLRERLIAQFDHIRELLGDHEVKTSLQWEEEVKSLKNDILCAEGDHEDTAKKVEKHEANRRKENIIRQFFDLLRRDREAVIHEVEQL